VVAPRTRRGGQLRRRAPKGCYSSCTSNFFQQRGAARALPGVSRGPGGFVRARGPGRRAVPACAVRCAVQAPAPYFSSGSAHHTPYACPTYTQPHARTRADSGMLAAESAQTTGARARSRVVLQQSRAACTGRSASTTSHSTGMRSHNSRGKSVEVARDVRREDGAAA
jgi:hypothetical protein